MAETDPRLVRLVSRHFDDLKGFGKLPPALAAAAAAAAWSATGSEIATFLGGLAGAVVGLIPYIFVADVYRGLGRVASSERPGVVPGLIGGASVTLFQLQTHYIPGPSVVWLACSLYMLWFAIDGWPWRWYYIALAAAAVYVALGRTTVAHPTDFAWMAPRLWVFSLVMIMAGIADHVLLLRTLRRTTDSAEEPAS